jgi:hypothetical protein
MRMLQIRSQRKQLLGGPARAAILKYWTPFTPNVRILQAAACGYSSLQGHSPAIPACHLHAVDFRLCPPLKAIGSAHPLCIGPPNLLLARAVRVPGVKPTPEHNRCKLNPGTPRTSGKALFPVYLIQSPPLYVVCLKLLRFAFPNRSRCQGRNTPDDASSCRPRSGRSGQHVHCVKEQRPRPRLVRSGWGYTHPRRPTPHSIGSPV